MSHSSVNINDYLGYVHKFVQKHMALREEQINLFIPYLEIRQFAKKQVILAGGQVENYLNLVVKGLVRKYILIDNREKTLQLATEGHVVQSEHSFYRRHASDMNTEALESSLLISIRHDNFQRCMETIDGAEQLARQLMTYMFIKKDAHYLYHVKNTARQRFIHYITHHPQMLQRVPQKILASYLDIKPETFSRMKRLLKVNY